MKITRTVELPNTPRFGMATTPLRWSKRAVGVTAEGRKLFSDPDADKVVKVGLFRLREPLPGVIGDFHYYRCASDTRRRGRDGTDKGAKDYQALIKDKRYEHIKDLWRFTPKDFLNRFKWPRKLPRLWCLLPQTI